MIAFKRISALILALCLVFCLFSFVSCNDNTGDKGGASNNNQTGNNNQTSEETGKIIDLSEYVVVIPDNSSTTVDYAAQNFVSLVEEKTGTNLKIVEDSVAPLQKEILIGNTNREESKTQSPLEKMQYLLFIRNEKIVMQGSGIYVGAACGDFINKYAKATQGSPKIDISSVPSSETLLTYAPRETSKSVIFMIGDGMGFNHILLTEEQGLDGFVAKEFPFAGESVTRSQSVINGDKAFTDSAASATAMSTGYKTINGYIGVDKDGNSVLNVRELASSVGAKTGVITTDVITGATPSAYMCHINSRYAEEELQGQIDALIADKKIDYCAGSVDDNLTAEVKNALSTLSKNNSSFFLMVEEGMIDKASHSNKYEDMMSYVRRFDDAIEYATQFALCHPDVALVVTADHETGKLLPGPTDYGYGFRTKDHTNVNVPIYSIGAGTGVFKDVVIENIELAKFCAGVYASEPFGQTAPIE
ncbi:MAG: alkaline phosphatase [Clostridia bacterium]|nr:alkaline phosphatase [Clostridia bacterium]